MKAPDNALADELILDELFDLILYRELHKTSEGELRKLLEDLISVEVRHHAFWLHFFGRAAQPLDFGRRLKLRTLVGACRIFGSAAVHLVLEATEVYGIRKYLMVWEQYKDQPLGQSVREILTDEFRHEEDIVVQMSGRKISPERVRNVFLGLNDGLVEILGALSGFFATFGRSSLVLMASSSVAVAGALSMAAGAYVASSSEGEVRKIEKGKAQFLGGGAARPLEDVKPLQAALMVGGSYFLGAAIPVTPIVFGATTMLVPFLVAGLMIMLVSLVVSFLSGMDIRKRVALNIVVMSGAVGISYAIGALVRRIWGINV